MRVLRAPWRIAISRSAVSYLVARNSPALAQQGAEGSLVSRFLIRYTAIRILRNQNKTNAILNF
jgi:hypothetical protein